MRPIVDDVRYALRHLRKLPAFAPTAITVLALGLGANLVVFTLLNSLTLCAVIFVLASASFFAALLPARRAASVDPILALRSE